MQDAPTIFTVKAYRHGKLRYQALFVTRDSAQAYFDDVASYPAPEDYYLMRELVADHTGCFADGQLLAEAASPDVAH